MCPGLANLPLNPILYAHLPSLVLLETPCQNDVSLFPPQNHTVCGNIQPHTSHTFSILRPSQDRSGIFILFQRSCKISLFPLTLYVCFHT